MAVLSDADRAAAWADWMRDVSGAREACAFTKAQGRAAFDAMDQWFSGNAATLNSALPVAFRTNATTAQKARLLMAVIRQRYLKGA